MKKLSLLLTVLFMFLMSCQKDDDITNSQQEPPQVSNHDAAAFAENFGNSISRTFLGNVVDTNNNPIVDVLITIGNTSVMTDINGVFIIQDASVNERFGYITAEKAGFMHASRAVVPSEGTNKVTIMMLAEAVVGSTSSGSQDTIELPNGASVRLEGDFIKEDGTNYAGNVNVIMHHLDPADEDMNVQMPGMLYAANAQNEERMLQTFGMLAVELRGENGEELNIAQGSTAEIRVPLDDSLLADAPSTIPLWYFDEINGYWIEEGQATLVGNAYVGTVSHFTFWNCDVPSEVVYLCINITNAETGAPMEFLRVDIASENFGSRTNFTNGNGIVCGLVPANDILELTISNSQDCNQEVLYFENLGALNEDTILNISLTISLISETVIGQLDTCDGEPVTNGYIELTFLNQSYFSVVDNGNFEINLLRCDGPDSFIIQAFDYVNLQQTASLNYAFTTPVTDLGTIQSCNSVEEFITYNLGDDDSISYFSDINGSIADGGLGVFHANLTEDYLFDLYVVNFNGVGSYNNCIIRYRDQNGNDSVVLGELFEGQINVTSYGGLGEFIDLNYSGNMIDENGDSIPITGSLHVQRDF